MLKSGKKLGAGHYGTFSAQDKFHDSHLQPLNCCYLFNFLPGDSSFGEPGILLAHSNLYIDRPRFLELPGDLEGRLDTAIGCYCCSKPERGLGHTMHFCYKMGMFVAAGYAGQSLLNTVEGMVLCQNPGRIKIQRSGVIFHKNIGKSGQFSLFETSYKQD